MKRLLTIVLLLCVGSCSEKPPVLAKLPEHAVVLAFGDSLTYGSGVSEQYAYPEVLSARTGLDVINEGRPGEITRDGKARLPALLERHHPDLLILIHGGNDMLRKIPDQEIIANIRDMLEQARSRGIAVVMLGVPRPNLFLLDSADFYSDIAESEAVPIDLDTLPKVLGDAALKSDPIHPNVEGYRLIAENIEVLLHRSGALAPR